MGKCLIINGADFSTNAIENVITYLYPYEIGNTSSPSCEGNNQNIFGFNTSLYAGREINFAKVTCAEQYEVGLTLSIKITSTIKSDASVDSITVLGSHTLSISDFSDGYCIISFNTITLPSNCLIGITTDIENEIRLPVRYTSSDLNLPIFSFLGQNRKVSTLRAYKLFDVTFGLNY